jgi:hypothetical protein
VDPYACYRDLGYGIVRAVFPPDRIARLLDEADRLHALGSRFTSLAS